MFEVKIKMLSILKTKSSLKSSFKLNRRSIKQFTNVFNVPAIELEKETEFDWLNCLDI